MKFILLLLQIVFLVMVTTKCFTVALTCDKLIIRSHVFGNIGLKAHKEVMEAGRYEVRTIGRATSAEVRSLIAGLTGASDVRYTVAWPWFTAILQPKDLKKLCMSTLVKSIRRIETMDINHDCPKLIRGDPSHVIPGSYIVMIKQDEGITGIIPMITAASDDMEDSVMVTSVRNFQSHTRRHGAVMSMNREGVKFVCRQPKVDYIEEDQEVTMASPTSFWHLDRLDQLDLPLDGEYSSSSNGSGVDIYIFDTGINFDHSEFEGRAKYDSYDPTDERSGTNQQGRDCHGHGTHVAALAAGKTFGVAKGATLYSMRVLSCSGSGSFISVILGLSHVIGEHIAQRERKIIVSMSLCGPCSQAVDSAIRDATEEGILVVVAAGNDFRDACKYSPGASSYALTVGGTQRNDDLYLQLFSGTNYGKCVDIFAPGQDIRSAGLAGLDSVATRSGTSQATPLVSGGAAVYWSTDLTASASEIKDILIFTCTRDRLNIDGNLPPEFRGQSPNCLLYIDPHHILKSTDQMKVYEVFHSVPSAQLQDHIVQMEERSYALIFIYKYQLNSTLYYSLIFKHMPNVDFKTLILVKLSTLKEAVNGHGYQLTLMYDVDAINYIAVLQKTDIKYSKIYRVSKQKHDSIYESSNDTLVSTTVALTKKGSPRYSSVYVQGNEKPLHWPSVSTERFLKVINKRYNKGMYLSHVSSVSTNPTTMSVIFRQMTAPSENYLLALDVDGDQVQELVHAQMITKFVPTVIAGLHTPNGLKFLMAFEPLL